VLTQVLGVAKLGLVVVATFAVCWAPFLATPGGALQVLNRLVPVKRGLYEDYVANFWCVTSPMFKWRRVYTQQVSREMHLPMYLWQVQASCHVMWSMWTPPVTYQCMRLIAMSHARQPDAVHVCMSFIWQA
jgi:hypothetical protein